MASKDMLVTIHVTENFVSLKAKVPARSVCQIEVLRGEL
jgi:hypothetical protein